jgi:hypothetical protein
MKRYELIKDQIVSPREFAMKLGLKPSAVYQLFKMGRLEGFQIVERGSIRIWLNASAEKLQQSGATPNG